MEIWNFCVIRMCRGTLLAQSIYIHFIHKENSVQFALRFLIAHEIQL